MTEKISQHKVSRMMELYFQGYSQSEIALKIKVDQSTVSLYISRFESTVDEEGLERTAEKYGIMHTVQSLHSLAAELKKTKLTVEEAKSGFRVHRVLQTCGIEEGNYAELIETCTKVHSDGFLDSAMKLNQLERSTGLGYEEIIAEYQATGDQIKRARENLHELTTKLKASITELRNTDKKRKLAARELNRIMRKIGLDMKRLQMVEGLAIALKKADVGNDELDNWINHQLELNKSGISLDNLIEILGKGKVLMAHDQGKELLKMLREYGGLVEAIQELKSRIHMLEKQASVLF